MADLSISIPELPKDRPIPLVSVLTLTLVFILGRSIRIGDMFISDTFLTVIR